MRLFRFLKSAFNRFFDLLGSVKKYDDTDVQSVFRDMPASLEESYGSSIKELATEIHQVYETANSKEFTIGVIGDYSVGKSSFVNAILGSEFLPVSVNPSTAIITKIKYGNDTKAVVKFSDGSERQMSYDEYMRYSAFNTDDFNERKATGTIARFANVVEAELYVKSDFLKNNNLCIVDTLGLSAAESDNKKTIESIRDSVVVIYVCGERGLTHNDKMFISDYLANVITDSFVCVNRIDLVRHDEREQLIHNVRLKLDSAIRDTDSDEVFPPERIYQVSSLYQEFANGFTDHKDWQSGVDYAALSGFMPMMNDLGQYIGERAGQLRKKAITKQLEDAVRKMGILQEVRKSELNDRANAIESEIKEIKRQKQNCEEKKAYIDSLFEGLSQAIYSYFSNVYYDLSQEANGRWNGVVKSKLLNTTDFGVGDYLVLKKDSLGINMNVFVSDKDALYAKLGSVTRFVRPTIDFFQKVLREIILQVDNRIEESIKEFEVRHSYNGLHQEWMDGMVQGLGDSIVLGYNPVIFNPMCRAAALAGIESTWMKNSTRKMVMFNAAMQEGVKVLEKPLKEELNKVYVDKIQYNLKKLNIDRTRDLKNEIASLETRIKKLESSKKNLRRQVEIELNYFSTVCTTLKESRLRVIGG